MNIVDTVKIDGYSVNIAQDECPENPFEAFDCEPPLVTFDPDWRNGPKCYNGAPDSLSGFVDLLPDALFARHKRVDLIRRLPRDSRNPLPVFKDSGSLTAPRHK